MWLPNKAGEENHAVFSAGVPAELYVRRRLLGLLPHQARGGAWPHGLARYAIPRLDKYFQQCQRTSANIITVERRGFLPRHMYLPGVYRAPGIRCHFIIAQETAKARILHKCRAEENV